MQNKCRFFLLANYASSSIKVTYKFCRLILTFSPPRNLTLNSAGNLAANCYLNWSCPRQCICVDRYSMSISDCIVGHVHRALFPSNSLRSDIRSSVTRPPDVISGSYIQTQKMWKFHTSIMSITLTAEIEGDFSIFRMNKIKIDN